MYRYNNNTCRACCCCCNHPAINNISNVKSPIEDVCDNANNCCLNNTFTTPSGCGCSNNIFPTNPMLAQSYVPIQYMDKTFTPYCALKNGTIFPELVTTYYPGQSMVTLDYLRTNNIMNTGGAFNV